MDKYTPGPWIIDGTYIVGLADPENAQTIAIFDVNSSKEDGALIAAAPELLEVLERFARAMEKGHYPELQGVACDAFAAIAKAKGE